jgi:hypothetical protein
MKKRILSTLVLAVASLLTVAAQETNRNAEVNVVLDKFTYPKGDKKPSAFGKFLTGLAELAVSGQETTQQRDHYEQVRAGVVSGIGQSRRVRILDNDSTSGVPVNYYVDGVLKNIRTTSERVKDDKGKYNTEYSSSITFNLQITDAKTGETYRKQDFAVGQFLTSSTETESISTVLGNVAPRVKEYIDTQFPVYANIIEGTVKKDKQKEVYIDLGEATKGFAVGVHFGVFVDKDGKQKQISKLEVKEIMGDDISLCKVKSGGSKLKEALDNGDQLTIYSLD